MRGRDPQKHPRTGCSAGAGQGTRSSGSEGEWKEKREAGCPGAAPALSLVSSPSLLLAVGVFWGVELG